MPLRTVLFGLVFLGAILQAKDHAKVTVEVVDSEASERKVARFIPGTNTQSSTTCFGYTCSTTTTPGQAPRVVHGAIPQVHVRAVMPDGRHVTLWCQSGLRKCENLAAASYEAEVDGDNLWIISADLAGKPRKLKYRYVGGW